MVMSESCSGSDEEAFFYLPVWDTVKGMQCPDTKHGHMHACPAPQGGREGFSCPRGFLW